MCQAKLINTEAKQYFSGYQATTSHAEHGHEFVLHQRTRHCQSLSQLLKPYVSLFCHIIKIVGASKNCDKENWSRPRSLNKV